MFQKHESLTHSTKCPSINTSFKPLHQWQEFKMEAWFPDFLCCMSHYYWTYNTSHTFFTSAMVAWAFTTSKSVAAHQIMFRWIFAIAEHDMDIPVHFQHIHGDGFETFMQMGTRGQVLGMKWAMHIFICLDCPTYRSWSSLSTTLWRHGQLLCTTCFDGLWEFNVILSLLLARLFPKHHQHAGANYQPSSERNDEPCISWTPALL